MRRYQYRLNDQNVSLGPWAVVQPLKYIETVPGETYGGAITVKATTGLMDKVIHSRAYYDLYAFYCPIRLLWSQFPEHLQAADVRQGSGYITFPTVTKLFPENFESSWIGNEGATQNGQGVNSAFLRRMYAMVGNQFFADEQTGYLRNRESMKKAVLDGEYDGNAVPALIAASVRPSTFDSSWKVTKRNAIEDLKIPISGENATLDLQTLRQQYAIDRFEKMRDYYGGRYVDVLRGYGVKADWGILQEPECIGVSNNDFRFVQRNSTGDNNFGKRNGYFEGEYRLKLRKTFTPEHGIIAIYAVARGDVFNTTPGGHILNSRTNLGSSQMWYDPITWAAYNEQKFPKSLMDSGASRGTFGYSPIGEHLRKGRNEIAVPAGTDLGKLPVFGRSMTEFLDSDSGWSHALCNPDTTDGVREAGPHSNVRHVYYDPETDERKERITTAPAEVSHYTEVRVAKRSPVQPAAVTTRR